MGCPLVETVETRGVHIVSDGAAQHNSCEKYFHNRSPHHVPESFADWPHQQRIERLNGDLEDWLRRRGFVLMRSAKKLLSRWAVHYDFVHEYKDTRRTPAQRIRLKSLRQGKKWLQLIRLAKGINRGGN